MGLASFNYSDWLKLYPELSNTKEPFAELLWQEAHLYLNDDGTGPITNAGILTSLMYMLTAHIAYLRNGDANGNAPSQIVGHIEAAGQGSVNVAASVGQITPQQAWFMQTRYGLAFWQATAAARTALYRPSFRTPLVSSPWGAGRPFI